MYKAYCEKRRPVFGLIVLQKECYQISTSLIAFSGLPGVGKTTIAKELCAEANFVYIRIDSIELALRASALKIHPAEDAGYRAAYSVALDNLLLGQTVVADSVNSVQETRIAWGATAERAGVRLINIYVICSDLAVHEERVENRYLRDDTYPNWETVTQRVFHAWECDSCFTIDTAKVSVSNSVALIKEANCR